MFCSCRGFPKTALNPDEMIVIEIPANKNGNLIEVRFSDI